MEIGFLSLLKLFKKKKIIIKGRPIKQRRVGLLKILIEDFELSVGLRLLSKSPVILLVCTYLYIKIYIYNIAYNKIV